MRKMLTLKKKKGIHTVTQEMIDKVEMNVEDIYGVTVAEFDPRMGKVYVDCEEDAEIELTEFFRAIVNTGRFDVLGIS